MKSYKSQVRLEAGTILAPTLLMLFVLSVTLASFLVLTQHQTFASARSQSWNHSMAVTEAGVEDALQMINRYASDSERLLQWAADVRAGGALADHWEYLGTNTYRATRTIGDPVVAEYDIYVNNSRPNTPSIRAEGRVLYDYDFVHSSGNLAVVGTDGGGIANALSGEFRSTELDRTVVVETRRDALWTVAMLADVLIDFKGTKVSTDSFNSADPNASDWSWSTNAGYGLYDSSRRLENGDVACNSDIIDSMNVGNADIIGHVSTGPGGTVKVGATGSVGSEDWVLSGQRGIEPGYASDDMNVRLPDMELPAVSWGTLPVVGGTGTNIDGVTYQHVITASGAYMAATLKGGVYIAPGVEATVRLTHDVKLGPSDQLYVHPAAERLTIYMEGNRFQFGGGLLNETGNAANFLYFGLPSNTELDLGGNASFVGAIYANHVDLQLGGGGKDTYDFIGATVTRTVKMNGHFNFHYDENLVNIGPSRGFIPTQWAEL